MPTYSHKNFERIAAAVGVDVADILQFGHEFEGAAKWYHLNTPPWKRQGGPTWELRNQAKKPLATHGGLSEEEVIDATARVGRLAELLEAVEATKSLEACSYKAARDAAEFAKLFPKGHQGNVAAIGWIEDMMGLYTRITAKEPGLSVRRPGPGRGQPTGPFLRFLQAAGEPLEIDFAAATARSRQRASKKIAKRRQK